MEGSARDVDVCVVLLITDERITSRFGQVAWLAVSEAAQLYEGGAGGELTIPIDASRVVAVRPHIGSRNASVAPVGDHESVLRPEQVAEIVREQSVTGETTVGSQGALVDQHAMVALVRDALDVAGPNMVVVTDRPLMPPPGYRYLIWEAVPGGVAMSMATLDPEYWGEWSDETTRQRIVKRRLRAALCSVLGTAIGLVRCDNPQCFLYADVDRVTRLDDFVRIGEEHFVSSLTGRGFSDQVFEHQREAVIDVAERMV
jgi:hypothetical protein